jgi:LysR family transcriptional regulator, transcriptional activator of nhaA
MEHINYKHLHYFWVVAQSGGVARAGERLHVTPQSISGQMRQLEAAVGHTLWRRAGRKLELTDTGQLVLDYADRLFTVGEELKQALRDRPDMRQALFRVGVTGSVVKAVAYRVIQPALKVPAPPRLLCREGRMAELLAQLAVHQLDLVISDRPMPGSMNVRGFNHLLLDCGVSFFALPALARGLRPRFPASLDGAPMLLPGGDSALRAQLQRWFDKQHLRPAVVAEFDDTAVMKAFGQGGTGVFAMPTLVAAETERQFRVARIGATEDVRYQLYAVSGERRLTHPAVRAISEAARQSQAALGELSPPA